METLGRRGGGVTDVKTLRGADDGTSYSAVVTERVKGLRRLTMSTHIVYALRSRFTLGVAHHETPRACPVRLSEGPTCQRCILARFVFLCFSFSGVTFESHVNAREEVSAYVPDRHAPQSWNPPGARVASKTLCRREVKILLHASDGIIPALRSLNPPNNEAGT